MYYAFANSFNKPYLCFQNLFNLAVVCLQIKNIKKDNYKSFLEDFNYSLSVTKECDIIENILKAFNKKSTIDKLQKVLYDKYSKRYILICDLHISNVLISSPNDITTINYVLFDIYFTKLIYFSSLERNVLIFINRKEILLCDVEDLKIIYRESIEKNLMDYKEFILYAELIDQEYLILFIENKYLIYKVKQEDKLIQFIFLKSIDYKYKSICTVQDKFVLSNRADIEFYAFNKEKFDLELLHKHPNGTNFGVKITDLKNNKIIIKYTVSEKRYLLQKYEIYDIEQRQQLKLIEFKTDPFHLDLLLFGDKYILEITYSNFILKDYNNLDDLLTFKGGCHQYEKEWDVYEDENGTWYILCNSNLYKFNNDNIEFIKKLEYPDKYLKNSYIFRNIIAK